ncbi:pickpocket protein 19-like [Pectinophora gossypiella]|uniref:pickpocket protein 19-like n=1 Tax=Pectinophora gossypiella TaxID=13191 RepID=UPI00214EAA2D|nr:pickpocket protein 19-like [Pectinophora gossypiella]
MDNVLKAPFSKSGYYRDSFTVKSAHLLFWTVIFCVSFGTGWYFLHYTWSGTLNKPFIVTTETSEYPIGQIDFPAIAVCNINRISKKALSKFAAEVYPELAEKESLEEVENMLLNLGRLIDYSYNESVRNHPVFVKMIHKFRGNTKQILPVMKNLAPRCEDMLIRCAWAGALVDCEQVFSLRRTANRGFCCIFNYVVKFKNSDFIQSEIKRQSVPGFIHGLHILLDPMLDDYAYPLKSIQGFDILIFDPIHYADPNAGRVIHRMSEPNKALSLELKSSKQLSTYEVRKYAAKTRKCYFNDEISKDYTVYSYSACIVFCRIATINSLCKCTPFFYAPVDNFQTCTLEDLRCLNKYKEKLLYLYPFDAIDTRGLETEITDSLICDKCLPDCEITQHRTKSYEVDMQSLDKEKDLRFLFFDNVNLNNKSLLSIFQPTHDATLVRLDVVYYWYEILSNVGGFCGIVIGFTFVCITEIVYFFTVRFVRHFCVNYNKYH